MRGCPSRRGDAGSFKYVGTPLEMRHVACLGFLQHLVLALDLLYIRLLDSTYNTYNVSTSFVGA
jgi:hypothetical protein